MKKLLIAIMLICLPSSSWASTLAYDSFSVYNNSDLNTHTADIGSGTWARHASYPSNKMALDFGRVWGGKCYALSTTPTGTDYAVEADLFVKTAPTVDIGVVARMDTTAVTMYQGKYNYATSEWQIAKYVTSTLTTATQKYADTLTPWTTYRVKLTVEHTDASTETIKLYVNGTLRVTYADTTAGRITAAGKAGLWNNLSASAYVAVHHDNFILKDISSTSDIKLFDFDNKSIIRRSGTSAAITVRGAYDGTPTGIEARVVQHGTSTEAVGWTALGSATIANGFFSGTISVPQGGWYNVQVRFANETGVVSNGANKLGVGIIVGLTGQSNMSNWNLYTDVVSTSDLSARQTALGKLDAAGNGIITASNTIVSALGVPSV
jgi:uncharacterized membrane protein YjfL (UPF0719 family)